MERFNANVFNFEECKWKTTYTKMTATNLLKIRVRNPHPWVVTNENLLDRKALGVLRICLSSSVAFNISGEKITEGVMDKVSKMYENPSTSNYLT